MPLTKKLTHPVATLLCCAVLLTGIILCQKRLTTYRNSSWQIENMSFLPKSDQIKRYFLGFHTIFADYLWIKTTLYFGSHTLSDKQYPYLASLVDITSRLNPRLFPAYEFAGVILPAVGGSRDIARIILMRGMSVYGTTQWRIPFYLGWMYYQYYNDPLNAARYLAAAGQCPDAPDYIRGLAATMYARSDNVELGKVFLYDLYKSSGNPQTRKFLVEKLDKLSKGNVAQ